ncbi:TetR/AcrR family transcriptional regulator C-terminal domain-containing protein [Paenibacillus sp. NPDC058071]|uniref:TetR/AcrR family transcriptional regulator n=1 Tax=Paenibacillus sp. NPDC058071 TaxID=3346326 RepID=UPI0036D7E1AE
MPNEQDADLRVRRTKKMLQQAFIAIMQDKEFYKISIQELARKADVNRATFYLHYRDMDDFIDQLLDELFSDIEEIFRNESVTPYRLGSEIRMLVALFTYIGQHAQIYKLLIVSKSIPKFTNRLIKRIQELSFQHVQQEVTGISVYSDLNISRDVASWYVSSAMIGTIASWLEQDMPYSPQYLAEQIVNLNPFQLLREIH